MGIYVWCELVCENCSSTTAGRYVTGQIPRREMREEAKKEGWLFDGVEVFCSSKCKDMWSERDAFILGY